MTAVERRNSDPAAYPGDRGVIALCAVTGEEVRWDMIGRPDACQSRSCATYLKPPEQQGDPAPVTVPEGDDPWAVLRTMGKFMPGTERGECEIIAGCGPDHPPSKVKIGLTILVGHPERVVQPVFDCRTRVVEVVGLAEWLKARGYEASACQWNRPNGMLPTLENRRWQLITGKAELPPLPNPAPTAEEIREAVQRQQSDVVALHSEKV